MKKLLSATMIVLFFLTSFTTSTAAIGEKLLVASEQKPQQVNEGKIQITLIIDFLKFFGYSNIEDFTGESSFFGKADFSKSKNFSK